MKNHLSFSVRHDGSKYKEKGMPNQDFANHVNDIENAVIAIVADGHGSARCFRSHIGSQVAVTATELCLKSWLATRTSANSKVDIDSYQPNVDECADFLKSELHKIIGRIIDNWFNDVMNHEKKHPLKDDQKLAEIEEKYRERYIKENDETDMFATNYRCHAYGTTLMVAVVTDNYWFVLHTGDGKCVVLYENGTWALPVPWDNRCSFNTTTSICDDDSLNGFRYWFGFKSPNGGYIEYGYGVPGQERDFNPNPREVNSRPIALFIGTDGVEDSYPREDNDRYIINFYRNRIITLVENGFDGFQKGIDDFARDFADNKSTDDVSIAGIVANIADLPNKSELIVQMKHDSELHEATETDSVARRDADEKRITFDSVQKRTEAVTTNQERMNNRVDFLKEELEGFHSNKHSYQTALNQSKREVDENEREMSEAKLKIRQLSVEHSKATNEERALFSTVSRLDTEVKSALSKLRRVEATQNTKANALKKATDKHAEFMDRVYKIYAITSGSQTPNNSGGACPNPSQQNQPDDDKTAVGKFVDKVIDLVAPDIETQKQSHEQHVAKAKRELQYAQSQVATLKRTYENLQSDLSTQLQRHALAQKIFQDVDRELRQAEHRFNDAEAKSRKLKSAERQHEDRVADLDRKITIKQSEITKLQAELDTLREQTKKQTDQLAAIKAALEKAEEEAKKAKAVVQYLKAKEVRREHEM